MTHDITHAPHFRNAASQQLKYEGLKTERDQRSRNTSCFFWLQFLEDAVNFDKARDAADITSSFMKYGHTDLIKKHATCEALNFTSIGLIIQMKCK